VRSVRSTSVAGIWFRVALLVTSAQVFLSYQQHEWHPIDFTLCCAMLIGTGIWAMTERHRHRLEFQRRRARWICINCGYDLRATPDRCPECGHAHAHAHEASSA
jgi:hypothetical protein